MLTCPPGREGTLSIPACITEIAADAFGLSLGLTEIRIPAACTALERAGFHNCLRLKRFSVAEGNPAFRAVDGVLYSADGGTLLLCPPGHGETLEIPERVTAIANGAFRFCPDLRCLRIPMGLTNIEPGAFRGCYGVERVMLYRGEVSLLLHRGIPIRE